MLWETGKREQLPYNCLLCILSASCGTCSEAVWRVGSYQEYTVSDEVFIARQPDSYQVQKPQLGLSFFQDTRCQQKQTLGLRLG